MSECEDKTARDVQIPMPKGTKISKTVRSCATRVSFGPNDDE